MTIIDILSENRLATTSVILGMLAIVIFFMIPGVVNVFLYLGIPAIVTGAVSMMRLRKKRVRSHIASVVLPITGIVLGVLSMVITLLAL
jgi:hypothetical protein